MALENYELDLLCRAVLDESHKSKPRIWLARYGSISRFTAFAKDKYEKELMIEWRSMNNAALKALPKHNSTDEPDHRYVAYGVT